MVTSLTKKLSELVISYLQTKYKIKLIYVFGSYATQSNNANSDIDIAILCDTKLDSVERWHIAQELAEQLNLSVDLVDLLTASTVLQNQVITKGVCIYDKTSYADTYGMQIMSMYQHLNLERSKILADYTGTTHG